jgi:predicted GIY-YIG superfamily endonuclease
MARRLRQHNGELSGGAWYTAQRGPGWRVRHVVSGFRGKAEATSFERRIQYATRRCKTDKSRARHYRRMLLEHPHLSLDQCGSSGEKNMFRNESER